MSVKQIKALVDIDPVWQQGQESHHVQPSDLSSALKQI